jgi:hypothetical protein
MLEVGKLKSKLFYKKHETINPMKNRIKPAIFLLFAMVIGLFSCQEESQELIQTTTEEQIIPNSPLGTLISGTAANSGSSDNFLDNSSCFTVALPVTITIGNTVIVISDEDDLDDLEDLIDDLYDGDADIQFEFPFTIVFGDYSELVVENEEQLQELYNNCDLDVDQDDIIECIDFKYPISFSIFNSVFDVIDTVVIQNDEQLYNFLDELDDGDAVIASLNYPVTLVYPNGDTVEVNSNQALAEVLESVNNDCDDSGVVIFCSEDEVFDALISCPWEMDAEEYEEDDFYITFNEEGGTQITDNGIVVGTGEWALSESSDGLMISLSGFEGELSLLNDAWLITDCDEDDLEFENDSTYIDLDKECEGGLGCDFSEVVNALQECQWEADSNLINAEIEYLIFDDQGSIYLNDDPSNDIGGYGFSIVGAKIFLDLTFTNSFTMLNGQWELTDCDNDDLYFVKENNYLELDQYCDPNESPFTCFESNEEDLSLCDDGTDGPYIFDLTTVFEACITNDSFVSYHPNYEEAEINGNSISNPQSYQIVDTDATVYVRVEIGSAVEIFDINLSIEDCGNYGDCDPDSVSDYLSSCDWTVTNFNGEDHLVVYELSFEEGNTLVVTNTDTDESFEGFWELQGDGSNTSLFINSVSAPEIQEINGDWTLVECSESSISLVLNDTEMIIESDCD